MPVFLVIVIVIVNYPTLLVSIVTVSTSDNLVWFSFRLLDCC